jgi:hypothetical protein
MTGGVHQPEEPTPADAEHVDRAKAERQSHALHILHQLVLRALLDGDPLRTPVTPVIPEDEAESKRVGERPERADKPGRVRARAAVEDEARRPVPHDLGVEGGSVDVKLHCVPNAP